MKLSEKKRLQIIDTATRLFASQGLEATSMDAVAAEAQVSKRTVYNHFATKTALFQAVLESMFANVDQGDKIEFDASIPLESQLKAIANNEIKLLTSETYVDMARVAFIQMLQDPQLAKSLNGHSVGCMRYFDDFLSAANESGVVRIDDIPLAAKQFVYQFKSLIFYPLLYGIVELHELDCEYLVDETIKLFVARYT
ncbi:TetR family transcriptional regulator [Alteromonas sp. I4]|nr:TetR family transcriptional regulator [Alteromonas sp. I4]